MYEQLRDAIRAEEPIVLATVIEGPADRLGMKLLARPDGDVEGTLGEPELDRVVVRDALGNLESGVTATRHYGLHGEARDRDLSVFIEPFAPPPLMGIFESVAVAPDPATGAKVLGY